MPHLILLHSLKWSDQELVSWSWWWQKRQVQHTYWELLSEGSMFLSAAKRWVSTVGTSTVREKVRLCSDWQKDRLHPISYSFQKELSTLSTFSWAADWHVSSGQSLLLKFHSVYVIMKNELQIMTFFINLFLLPPSPRFTKLWWSRCNTALTGYDVTHPGSSLSAFCVSIVGHGRSPFLFEGVSHPMGWWGYHSGHSGEDIKGQKQVRTWERPWTWQRVFALLWVWAIQGSACIFSFFWWLVETKLGGESPIKGHHTATLEISGRNMYSILDF